MQDAAVHAHRAAPRAARYGREWRHALAGLEGLFRALIAVGGRLLSVRTAQGVPALTIGSRLVGFPHLAWHAPRLDISADRRSPPLLVLGLMLLASLMAVPAREGTVIGASPPLSDVAAARIAALAAEPATGTPALAGGDGELAFQAFELPAAANAGALTGGLYTPDGTLQKPLTVHDYSGGVDDQLRMYIVRSGDTLSKIAARFDLKMSSLFWANKLGDKDTIHIGQVLAIPPVDGVLYTVKAGDTIDTIAIAFYADVDRIEAYNGLVGDTVVIGETIMVPDGRGRPIPSAPPPNATPAAAAATAIPAWHRASSTSCTGWRSTSRAPTWIRVLRSYGAAAGKVQTIDFSAYVANVMAWEWPSYYPAAALQAGAIAVKQYAWYYTMHWRGGETSSGACFDVRDTVSDQIFRPETRRAGSAQRSAIAATWSMTVRRMRDGLAGQFILTGYRSGTIASCGAEQDGYHLYQSGVFDCARQGKTLEEIERIYYGPTLQLIRATS